MKKKVLSATVLAGSLLAIAAQFAYAASVEYNYRLPSTGTIYTSGVTKTLSSDYASNRVDYFGKPGKEIVFWVRNQADGKTISDSAYLTDKGSRSMKYFGPGSNYLNKKVDMAIKTSISTWTEVDVSGEFFPEY